MVCVRLCAVNILLILRFISLLLLLSLLSQSRQSLLASLTCSVIERKETKKNLWWQKNRRASSNKKLFCGHFTHSTLVHTSVLVLGEFFWECSRVILRLSDETFTETLETRKQTQTGKKIKYRNEDTKKTKGFGCVIMKASHYNLGLMYLSSFSLAYLSITTTTWCCHHQWTNIYFGDI